MPPESLADVLGFTLLISAAGRKIWLQLILLDKQRVEPERQQGMLKGAIQLGWEFHLTQRGLPGEHSFRCRWVTPPLAALSKTTTSIHKASTLLFQFLLNSVTTNTVNKYSYHFCKWVRFCITHCVTVLSMSTPPMLLHAGRNSGSFTLKRRYFGSKKWDLASSAAIAHIRLDWGQGEKQRGKYNIAQYE